MIRFITLAALVAFATPALAGGNPNATSRPTATVAERSPAAPRTQTSGRVDATSNTQLTGRPTVSVNACGVTIDAEHVSAKNTIEMMGQGVGCIDAATRQVDAGTRRDVSLAGIEANVATYADGDLIATGQAAPYAAISVGNGGMFMPGMAMPGLGQMGTLAFQSASMGQITPPPASPAPSTTTSSATDARVRELESEVVSLRAANDALAE
ncbi:hypothetical protein KBC55_03585 [Patescibacteria group bacterium]|nr:hypothetical protein [Patescibacteria group bacterium]